MFTYQSLIAQSVYHESVEPFAYAYRGDLYLRLRIGTQLVDCVEVVHFDKFQPTAPKVTTPAFLYAKDGTTHDIYQAQLTRDSKRFKYFFVLHVGQATYCYSRLGVTDSEPPGPEDTFEVPYLGERDTYQPPAWTIGTTYYQIFPERFHRGTTKKVDRRKLTKWDAIPTTTSFFGGNLQGVIEKLDYLSDLGVEVIYCTPIFKAPSNHKYDTVDYFAIDPHFGSEDDLRTLVDESHKRDMKVVLDAVFNHMGMKHPIFQDLLQNAENSKYASWIYAKSWPLSLKTRNYETFGYIPSMPKWRTAAPEVEEYLCQIGEYWVAKTGIDGWRLDVSDEVEHTFWKHFRTRIKSLNPDALICGEIWQVATPWLRGDEFDSVMNYPFARAVLQWLATQSIDAYAFSAQIEQIRIRYPEPVLPTLWNLLDSHDTPRLLTECDEDKRQAMLASFMQFTAVGSPVLYYGDEVGMTGGPDPLCRGGMIWDEGQQDQELLIHYKTLLTLRKHYRALREGSFRPAFSGHSRQLYAFVRILNDAATKTPQETIVCFVNNQKHEIRLQFLDPNIPTGVYACIYGARKGEQIDTRQGLTLPGKSASMWLLK